MDEFTEQGNLPAPSSRGRPFSKGNPGRMPGSKNRTTIVAEALLKREEDALIRKAIELAKAGDVPMLKFLLDRILPKERSVYVDLPPMGRANDAVDALRAIMDAAGNGRIAPSEASAFATLVEAFVRTKNVAELLSKAEELALSAAAKKREEPEDPVGEIMRSIILNTQIRDHATAVAALAIWGEPRVDEPLIDAWVRTLECLEVRVSASMRDGSSLDEVKKIYSCIVNDPTYREVNWNHEIPHEPEVKDFAEVFRTAPVWLLQFTSVWRDARFFKIDLPDISAEPTWGAQGIEDSKRWPLLPLGTMAAGDPTCIDREEYEKAFLSFEKRFYYHKKNLGVRLIPP